jgi:hypothetical protein
MPREFPILRPSVEWVVRLLCEIQGGEPAMGQKSLPRNKFWLIRNRWQPY